MAITDDPIVSFVPYEYKVLHKMVQLEVDSKKYVVDKNNIVIHQRELINNINCKVIACNFSLPFSLW